MRNLRPNLKAKFCPGVLVSLIGLCACGGPVRYPSYYTLNVPAAPASKTPGTMLPGSVEVGQFQASEFLTQGSIVYRPSPERIGFYFYNRWAEDPRRTVRRAMLETVESLGIFHSAGPGDGDSADYSLTGDLEHLEEVDRGSDVSIRVVLSAQLTRRSSGAVVWQSSVTKTSRIENRSVDGVVSEMSVDLGSAIVELASSLRAQLGSIATEARSGAPTNVQ